MCHNIINFVLQRILNLRVLKHGKYLPLLVLFRNLPIRKADTDFKPAGSVSADREMQCLLLSAVCPTEPPRPAHEPFPAPERLQS